MPKKIHHESPEEQSERFRQAVRDAEAAGTLIPTEADAALERAMTGVKKAPGDAP